MEAILTNWGIDLQAVACEHCNSAFLLPQNINPQKCPICYQDTLDPVSIDEEFLYAYPPEMTLPFLVSPEAAVEKVKAFAQHIPFQPTDLKKGDLIGRLRHIYIPLWLVDADIRANWQAEAGFHYEVVSHREDLSGSTWQTREIKETRTNWEPRAGTLERHYDNISAPAIEHQERLQQRIGGVRSETAEQYNPSRIKNVFTHLPERSPDSARPEAQSGFKQQAAQECQKAAGADEWRQFRWSAQYINENWTQLLIPMYSLFYLDDQNEPRAVYVNGQTGQVWGQRRASMKQAQMWTILGGISMVGIFLFSVAITLLGLATGPVAIAVVSGLFVAVVAGLAGIGPVIRVSRFNKKYGDEPL